MTTPDPNVYLLHIRDCCEELIQCHSLREQGKRSSFHPIQRSLPES
jgi:hypothetical protein